jgi:hypothetical protein
MNAPAISKLPPPLRVRPDMAPIWRDLDTDFDTAADKLVAAHTGDGDSRDLPILDLRTWGIVPADGQLALAPLGGHHEPKAMRSNAFTNLMAKIGAPAEFIRDRLPAPLQLATVNYLLNEPDKSMSATLRLRDDEVTAIVSDRYAPLDAEELMDAVRHALVQHHAVQDVRVKSVATGLVDLLRLTFPAEQQAIKVGDVSAIGLDISSSSFGRSAVHITALVWRLVCENGLRMAEHQGGFSFRHVGESQRLRDGIAEAIPTCLAQARGLMDRWKLAVTTMVEDVAKQIENLRELTQGERRHVEEELLTEAQVPALPESTSAYNLVNAITGAARQAEPARRLELESLAGTVLSRHVGRA